MRMRGNRKPAASTLHPLTPQRRLLLSTMEAAATHLDAKELYRRASEKDAGISLATVYRSLRLFREQGLIEARRLGQLRCAYEIKRSGEHQHLRCRGCGRVIEFQSPLVRELVAEVQQENDFHVTRMELYLEGYCRQCNEQRKPLPDIRLRRNP
jgi:Fur family ferric uptake transcriptional regulator